MIKILQKAKENKFVELLKELLSNKFFPLILIPISLLCYYLSLDIVMIYIIGILGTLIFLLLEDISPIVAVLLFMSIIVSNKHSPLILDGSSDYYYRTAILVQIFIITAILIASAIYRLTLNVSKKKFSLSPIFFSFCAIAVVFLLNGIFSKGYISKNLLYGLIMALCFLGIFSIVKDKIIVNQYSFVKIAYGFFAFAVVLVIELTVRYFAVENIFVDGNIKRELLTFGWGIWNTIGMYLVLCIPFVVYLAGKEKYGFIFAIASEVVFFASIMSCSRQSIIGALIVYPLCLLIMFTKGKNRLKNAGLMLAVLAVFIVFVLSFNYSLVKYFAELFKKIMADGELSGNGRMRIWEEALAHFKSAPIFGAGFYVDTSAAHFSGLNFIPKLMHSTIMEFLSSCGIVGLIVYLAHRVLTVISYLKNITVERTYLMLAIAVFLIISLFDNHLFNIFPTIIYSCLIAALAGSENKRI